MHKLIKSRYKIYRYNLSRYSVQINVIGILLLIQIVLGIFIVACLVEGYVIWNLMTKQEKLEDWTERYIVKIGEVNRNIDEKNKKFAEQNPLTYHDRT